jgi:mono/diheme cytochrome c family protein
MRRIIFIIGLAQLLIAESANAAGEVDYLSQIKPLLKARCYACHGSLKQEAGLRLDTGQLLRKGSENGAIVDFDAVAESELIERVSSDDEQYRMPPIGMPLSQEQIDALKQWISAKAPSPDDEVAEKDPTQHWAFQVPTRPERPAVSNSSWPRNEIDYFLQAQFDKRGLKPVGDATPAQLIRRVYLDLVGLPPTVDQLNAFLSDPSDAKYRALVDELLASPQYGERWARHWMDVWRYSDWYGRRQVNDVRNSAPQIWRWRDWIVDSLNNDKSYARMIQEMLAADEIAPDDDSAWPATGYLIRNYYSLNPNEWMRFNVEFTGKAFLALTFNCAHCHDHKYDPIAHDDYFRLRAFFEPIGIRQDRVTNGPEPPPFQKYSYGGSRTAIREGMVRIFDDAPERPTWFYTDGDERNKVKDRGSIPPGVPKFLNAGWQEISPINLPMTGWYPGSRPGIQQTILARQRAEVEKAQVAFLKPTATVDTTAAEAQVAAAQKQLDAELEKAKSSGKSGALAGKQSLYVNAIAGRRIVQNTLPGLKSVPDGMTISFELRILKDNHVNFQLARDTSKGLTALYLAFVGGNIQGYKPGGFVPLSLGKYTVAADSNDEQNHFDVKLTIYPSKDHVLVKLTQHSSGQVLVADTPIALNGWNPTKNPHQPFTLDCRPGTEVIFDNFKIVAGDQQMNWDFEAPKFNAGEDVAGIDGWTIHRESSAAASSTISMVAGNAAVRASYQKLKIAQAALKAISGEKPIAALRLAAAKLKLESLRATILADNTKKSGARAQEIERLAQAAYDKQLKANLALADWRVQDTEFSLGKTQQLPDSDKTKKGQIASLTKKLTTAKNDLEKAKKARRSKPMSTEYALLSPTTSKTSTGRRSALAYWITNKSNPLTARVAINHIWMRHFHSPLVESVADFGRNGKLPSHPQLLDWLAVELQQNKWSMKHIHRLIVTSRAYSMSSSGAANPESAKVDSANRFLWRMNQGRMEAEVIRDSLLAIAGSLDKTIGGPVLLNTEATKTTRRSLYYEVYPENGGNIEMSTIFDPPDPGECFRRTRTIVPQQALALSNSKLVHASCSQVAARIAKNATNSREFIKAAFETVLSRSPIEKEVSATLKFLDRQRAVVKDESKVKESLLRVLFNHNDFVTIR